VLRANNQTAPAPRPTNKRIRMMKMGKLRETCGMRGPCTVLSDPLLGVAVGVITLPQTWQRVAFSLRRVPQVGHNLLEEVVFWFVIEFINRGYSPVEKIIP